MTDPHSDPIQAESQPVNQTAFTPPPANNARRKGFLMLGGAVVLGLAAYGTYAVMTATTEETDDAYVAGNIVQVNAREAGSVIAVHGEATQAVKAGQPLVDFDPAVVDAQLASAEADLAKAVRQVRSGEARVDTAGAEIAQAQVRLAAAQSDLARRQKASGAGAVSGEEVAHAAEAVEGARAALALAQSHRADALATVDSADVASNPAVLSAIAAVKRAALAKSHLHLVAPVDGIIGQRMVQLGQQVAPGTPLMTVVPLQKVWVDANFRETQLADLRIGQPVKLWSDVYGKGVKFHGKVAGLSAGSGAAFALLPAQNASGNWIKVTQRVPVRIALDAKELDAHPLRLGLSMTVEIDTSNHAGQPVTALPAKQQLEESADKIGPEAEARIARIIATNAGGRR